MGHNVVTLVILIEASLKFSLLSLSIVFFGETALLLGEMAVGVMLRCHHFLCRYADL